MWRMWRLIQVQGEADVVPLPRHTNGWTPDAADRFIAQAQEVFPGAYVEPGEGGAA